MRDAALPQLPAEELARRLDVGEPVQVLDIRAPEKVALDPQRPVAVICGHGNSSKQATVFLRQRGLEAYSVAGGMAAWETVYVARRLTPTPSLEHVVQVDRVGKGALSYVLASQGEAVVVDPGRHVERYDTLLAELDARPVAVLDTHMHADYLSGAGAAAARWKVPYRLHPDAARSPYDDTPGRLQYQPLADGDQIAFGRATLQVEHLPGHTLGSVALIADDGAA